MTNLKLEKTKETLAVDFNVNGICTIEGSSFPENTSEFFKPLLEWFQNYMLEITDKIELNLKFDYLNSSSIKFVSDIIDKLEIYYKSGGQIEINWYYEENDEDIHEMGEDLKEEVTFSFNLIEK